MRIVTVVLMLSNIFVGGDFFFLFPLASREFSLGAPQKATNLLLDLIRNICEQL